jgi:prepilin-type N-terminal cleavage/methylation domain-containing protein
VFKRLMVEEEGFTLIELLVTIAILAVLFGVVTLTLTGIGSDAESTVNTAELGVVQSAVDIYMADGNYSTITARGSAAVIDSGDTDAPFNTYLRSMPTKCDYSWDTDGNVSQAPGC